ncbi:MAG: hypothetical protein M1531_00155 [Chloroflexi bacterium]|nr:hypothetical protein [Chloroflexota bacterium]
MRNKGLLIAGVALLLAALSLGLAGNAFAWGPPGDGPGWTGPRGPGFGGMMGGCGWGNQGTGAAISLDQAEQQVNAYLADWGNPDLVLAEVMEFSNNFYAEVKEKSTGIHALELLVNKYNGAVFPEYGPNMMWNLKYSPMAGMMGGGMMGGFGRGPRGSTPTRNPDGKSRPSA